MPQPLLVIRHYSFTFKRNYNVLLQVQPSYPGAMIVARTNNLGVSLLDYVQKFANYLHLNILFQV